MKDRQLLFVLFIMTVLTSCVHQKVLHKTLPDYMGRKIENKKLLIAPIPSEIKTGRMIRSDSEEYLNQYHLNLISNLHRILNKESNFRSVYYSDMPIYPELVPGVLYLSQMDSFEVNLPKQYSESPLTGAYKKLNPDFILFFEVEMIDVLTNISSTRSADNSSNLIFRFTIAQKVKYVFWDVKKQSIVSFGHKVVEGDIHAIAKSIVENSPFSK